MCTVECEKKQDAKSMKNSAILVHSNIQLDLHMKGSVQHCIKSEIDVLRNEALNVFILVIYIAIGMWPKDRIITIALISWHFLSI